MMTIMIKMTMTMNKYIKNIISLSFLAVLVFLPLSVVAENEGFEVDFEDPLFEVEDWYPGSTTQTEKITVVNNLGFQSDFYFGAEPTSERVRLAEVLTVHIDQDQKNLKELFTSPINLGTLDDEEDEEFTLSISFNQDTDNNYEDETISFNFLVEPREELEDEDGEDEPSTGRQTLPVSSPAKEDDLEISALNDFPSQNGAVITWVTNRPATSKVIYGTEEDLFDFQSGPPSYGYFLFTSETEAKHLFHSVSLTDLESGTYYYRAVSHNDSLAISSEGEFEVLEGEVLGEIDVDEHQPKETEEETQIMDEEDEPEEERKEQPKPDEDEDKKEVTDPRDEDPVVEEGLVEGLAATLGDFEIGCMEIILLIILLLLVAGIIARDKLKEKFSRKGKQ